MNNVIYIPVLGMPEIKANDDIVQLVLDCLLKQNETILENDILVITQKIVSKAENRTVDINSITSTIEANELALSLNKDPKLVQLILNESQSIVKLDLKRGIIITENKIGHISANAGIDFSNVKGKTNATLLPENPDKSAKLIHKNLLNKLDVKKITYQSEFLKKVGILERADILSKRMTFKEKANMFYRLKRLLNPKEMGGLFKVIFAQKKGGGFSLGF